MVREAAEQGEVHLFHPRSRRDGPIGIEVLGQEIALALLSFTGRLIVVGFTLAKTEYAIGRLMAFDAEIIGTWGCLPEYYPVVLDMVLSGKINMEEFVETRPMSKIAETFAEAHKTPPMKRIVLTPDF